MCGNFTVLEDSMYQHQGVTGNGFAYLKKNFDLDMCPISKSSVSRPTPLTLGINTCFQLWSKTSVSQGFKIKSLVSIKVDINHFLTPTTPTKRNFWTWPYSSKLKHTCQGWSFIFLFTLAHQTPFRNWHFRKAGLRSPCLLGHFVGCGSWSCRHGHIRPWFSPFFFLFLLPKETKPKVCGSPPGQLSFGDAQ
jgi:hypothetical protein